MALPVSYDEFRANPVIRHKAQSDTYDAVFGILGFGTADGSGRWTSTFERALGHLGSMGEAGARVALVLPWGYEFLIDLDVLALPDQVEIMGGGVLRTTATGTGINGAFFTADGTTGGGLDGLGFRAPDNTVTALKATSVRDVTLNDCRLINATLVRTNLNYAHAGVDTSVNGNACRDLHITKNRMKLEAASASVWAGILLFYVVGAEVADNRIEGYDHGIQWWGGDAAPHIDGALANERKCSDLAITGNRLKNILLGAGIWGSMGKDIEVTGNIVKECGDVGIDFEGCDTATATGNTVVNCANGCLTTFSFNRNIRFVGNACRVDTGSRYIARVQNATASTGNKEVTFADNDFDCRSGIAYIAVETSERGIVKDNTTHNVYITTSTNNQKITKILRNDMLFDQVAAAPLVGIDAGQNNANGELFIEGNQVRSTVAQPAGSRGIRALQFDFNTDPINCIEANKIRGFGGTSMEVIWNGANPAFIARTRIMRNNLGDAGTTVALTETGAAPSQVTAEGNYRNDGTLWP